MGPWRAAAMGASFPQNSPVWSELNPRRKHDPPHRAAVLRSDNTRNRPGTAILTVNTGVRLAQVDVIEGIEEVGLESQVHRFRQGNRLGYGEVRLDVAWANLGVAPKIAEGPEYGAGERSKGVVRLSGWLQHIRRGREELNL